MENTIQEKYTVAFIFNTTMSKVLLVHKQKPEWQLGKVNGIGGKYEEGETGEQCIQRETREESNLDIPEAAWLRVGTMRLTSGNVGVYAARYEGNLSDAVKNHHEEVEWFGIDSLPENAISNLHWLVPLTLKKLEGTDSFVRFTVDY